MLFAHYTFGGRMAFSKSIAKKNSREIKKVIFVKGKGLIKAKVAGSGFAVGTDEEVYVNLAEGGWVQYDDVRKEDLLDKPEHGKIVVMPDLTTWEWQLNLDTGRLKLLKVADPKPFVSLSPDERFRYKIGNIGKRSRRW